MPDTYGLYIPLMQSGSLVHIAVTGYTNHHLPRPSVIERYQVPKRVLLRTDVDRARNNDHILCMSAVHGEVECNYADQF